MNIIFDENIIVFAFEMVNENGNPDIACITILFNTIDRCDSIYVTQELYAKYLKKLETRKKKYTELIVIKLLNHTMAQGKIKYKTYPPRLNCEQKLLLTTYVLLDLQLSQEAY
jgi:hypothetical protein